ncbi:putative Bardet-Biedl syndrome 7 protein [Monocercomonoides exilis]|uniref:putative Bardet-Biedl syndrome 7 protein n=1 Tax=Monocercomonoides exilis TaxID=2049356 RepID=UPI00355A3EFA|nr:putative Bardet-Biedl syndrome 7 protein [Monocercomonoides exilis]|eukprot:MONOS_11747.1-p1 / transcript=MONOS_11747.1 / gene=MONOS_11747 / organism=Monocercomonoides_exilis_PA203 / gene_product=Bardet-Biedl syndrome 7 / transcript_product=Bardet-Biedl syndrome 7 / location=Mono_scaffold00607:29300-33969(-) / protein_length=874 / sequence_SO=supercontig / SO=protein_coding / is_pseudo=false
MTQMLLNLNRVDFLQVGAASYNCLKVLPLGPKDSHQTIVVGDKNGDVTCLTVKKKVTNILWKQTLPGKDEVTAVNIGQSNTDQSQKVYVAAGNKVYGLSKTKGKIFKEVELAFADPVTELIVEDAEMHTVQDNVHDVYVEDQEKYFMMADETICGLQLVQAGRSNSQPVAVMGCHDKTIKVVFEGAIKHEWSVGGTVTALIQYRRESGAIVKEKEETLEKPIIYGTLEGVLGLAMVGSSTHRIGWEIEGDGQVNSIAIYDLLRNSLPVIIVGRDNGLLEIYGFDSPDSYTIAPPSLLYSYTLPEAICSVGGGMLTSLAFDEVVAITFSGKIVGFTTETFQEDTLKVVVVPTAPSKPKGKGNAEDDKKSSITPSFMQNDAPSSSSTPSSSSSSPSSSIITSMSGSSPSPSSSVTMKAVIPENSAKKLETLAKEVIVLNQRLSELKKTYEQMEKESILTNMEAKLKSTLTLCPDEPRHHLVLESSTPLEFVAVYCNVYADVEATPNTKAKLSVNQLRKMEKSQMWVGLSRSSCGDGNGSDGGDGSGDSSSSSSAYLSSSLSSEDGNKDISLTSQTLSCVLTCDAPNITRVEAKFRFLEGKPGVMKLLVVPRSAVSTAATISHDIRPLCLHRRLQVKSTPIQPQDAISASGASSTSAAVQEKLGPPLNVMKITGPFSAADAHTWMHQCFDNVPPRSQSEIGHIEFISAFLGTKLTVDYKASEIIAKSDNISALAVIKEHISKKTIITMVKTKVSMEVKDETVKSVLKLVHPLYNKMAVFLQQYEFIGCLKEIKEAEDDDSFFSDEQLALLSAPAASGNTEYIDKVRTNHNYLQTIITNLFIDYNTFHGIPFENRLVTLKRILSKPFPLDEILSIFLR